MRNILWWFVEFRSLLSVFGGKSWKSQTAQYYYHGFLKEQPDFNWRNPQVQQIMLDVMRFWLDKGVDGFRIDVMELTDIKNNRNKSTALIN
jgi:glycosidase